jgi:hypothetical protein
MITIGSGDRGYSARNIYHAAGPRHQDEFTISQNSHCLWINGALFGSQLTVFRDTPEASVIMGFIGLEQHEQLARYVGTLVLARIEFADVVDYLRYERAWQFEAGGNWRAAKIRAALGIDTD